MKGKYIGLLVILLFGFAALLTPGVTMAVDCPPGTQTHYDNGALGTFCAEEVYVAGDNTCGTTACSGFQYEITSLLGESVSQVALTIPAAEFFCTTEIVRPTEKSVKIRLYEPSTGFSYLDETTDVITWDALKLDPSDKTNIDVFLTPMGAEPQLMELKTASGQQYITINGPKCCAETTLDTERKIPPRAFGFLTGFTFDIKYDVCTGEPKAPTGFDLITNGVAICDDSDGCRNWYPVKKLGPRSGAVLFAQNMQTEKFTAFYGFGNRIYIKEPVDPFNGYDDCFQSSGPYETVIFENKLQVTYSSCGEEIDVKKCVNTETGLSCTTSAQTVVAYFAPLKTNGLPDTKNIYKILYGPSGGTVIYGNPTYYLRTGAYRP